MDLDSSAEDFVGGVVQLLIVDEHAAMDCKLLTGE